MFKLFAKPALALLFSLFYLLDPVSVLAQNQKVLKNQAAKKRIANATEVRLDKNDLPVKISFEKGTRINSNDSFDKILGLPTHKQLIQKKSFKDKLGYQHIRLQETYEGLEVLGSQYIVHQKGNQLISANGKIRSSISVSTQPAISETTALQNALKHVNATQYMWQSSDSEKFIKNEKRDQKATFYPKGTLAISSKNYKNEESEKLVYQFDIYASVPLSRRLVEVDAHSGEVVNDISRIHTTEASGTGQSLYDGVVDLTLDLDGSAYGLADNSRGGGIYTFDLMNGTNYSSAVLISEDDNFVNESDNQAGVSAQFGAAATYDYFFNNFGRDSYDDDDASIYSYVHYSSGYFNAFWDGSRMTYGDGDGVSATALVSLDIVGHEIAHAVTEHSAGLVYSYESGALNESFSDIFGQSIEFENFPETASWNLADQIYTDGTSMIRSMSNPNDQGQPDTYLGDLWYSGSGDNGGVHYNSGVQNFWYYLIVEGGTGTNDIGYTYDVSAIGLEAAQQIAYRNLTTYLTSTSQYIDARAGAEQAAIDLYGEESTEYESVVEAWNAVGVPSADPVLSVTDDIAYNDVPLGYTQIIEVDILNQGNGLLTINNIEFNHADFSTSETTLSLGSLESTTLEFGFTPSELGEINAEATITSNGGDAVISISGTGVEPPVISVTPESLEADLFSGETSEQTLTIENTGTSSLTWQMSVGEYGETATYKANKQFAGYSYFEDEHNQGNRSNGPIPMTTMASMTGNTEILVWTYYADMSTEYPNTLNAISQYYEDYTITETDVTDASELEALLADKDVFLLPEQESGSTSFYENLGTAWASALETFVNGGGNIVLCGTGTGAHLIFSQFIEMSIEDIISGESMSVLDATNPLTLDLESTIIAQDATFLVSTTDEDAIVAVEYGSYVAVLSKAIDNGNFIYVGYDFYAYDDDAAKIISNAVQYGGSPAWLDIDISSGSIAAGESQEIVVVADAADLYGGTYTVDIVVESNDPENPSINIPYTLEVTGAPNIELDTDEIDFVDAYVNIENHLTINISNNGTDQLDVTAINSSNEVFTTDLTTFSLDPSESIEVTITYLPESVGTHSEQLTILSNDAGDPELIVALTGNAVEPPVISVSPESISDDLYTGESSNHAIEIDNTEGGSDLNWSISFSDVESSARSKTSIKTTLQHAFMAIEKGMSDPRKGVHNMMTAGGSDNFGYSWIDSDDVNGPSFEWEDISSTGISIGGSLSDDVVVGPYAMDMTFDFYDNSYSEFYLSSNGFIQFGSSSSSGCCSGQPIPAQDYINNVIAWAWRDGYPFGNTYYQNFANKTIIQFDGYGVCCTESLASATVQIVLYSSGNILVNYLSLEGSYTDGYHSVGIENSDGTDGLQVSFNSEYLHDELAILYKSPASILNSTAFSGTVSSGTSQEITITADATGLNGGEYSADIVIESNDPENPSISIPYTLEVTGAPSIESNYSNLEFEETYVGAQNSKTIIISNTGTDELVVTDINASHSIFSTDITTFSLAIAESIELTVTYSPESVGSQSGQLTISSNDMDDPEFVIELSGTAVEPPVISVSPESISDDLYTGESSNHAIEIDNTEGGSDLNWSISFSDVESSARSKTSIKTTLQHAFMAIEKGMSDPRKGVHNMMTAGGSDNFGYSWIDSDDVNGPSFEWEDISSTGISIGGSLSDDVVVGPYAMDMTFDFYDNSYSEFYLSSNGFIQFGSSSSSGCCSGQPIPAQDYINNVIAWAWRDGYPFGNTYYQNFANKTIIQFDGYGVCCTESLASATVQIVLYSSGNILVNYLSLEGSYTDGYHSVGIENSDGTDGLQVSFNSEYLHDELAILYKSPASILNSTAFSGTVSSGTSQEITITADATGLNGGEYSADIVIESNDPENPTLTIPYTLTVTGSPNMEVNTSELDFGDVFVGREVSLLLQITNTGTETLEVSNLIINDANYSTDENSFSVAPGESSMIEIFYEPQSEGSHSAILNIESNDPNQETLTVELSASGVVPPEIVVQTTVIETVILPGDYKAKYLTFSNVGQADLEWTATLDFLSDDTSWLYLFEQTGSLSPGSDKSIGIGIEARYLINGFYHASILIYSNDPSNPLEVINLELEVTNQNILRLGYEQVEVEASVTNVTIPIETNQYDVQVSSVSNWIAYENHQDEVIVSFTINSSTSSRNASIEVTAGEASATCTIIQKANTVLDVSPENSSNLNLFPNPNYGELNISSTEIASLELMDVSGKSYELDYVKDAEVIRVNLTQLNNGIYYVKIAMNDGTVEIKKVILQK